LRPLSELKQDFEMTRNLWDIIDVLKTVALIQFRSFQFKEKPNTVFFDELEACFSILSRTRISHPYLFDRKTLASAIVVITSDEGFLGELNTLLINTALDCRKSPADEIIVLGERGERYLEDMKERFTAFPGISEEASYKEAEDVRDYLIKGYRRKYGRILAIYPRFISMTTQRISVQQILPYSPHPTPSPQGGEGRGEGEKKQSNSVIEEMLIEPTENSVLAALVEIWMTFIFMDIFWSSKQSEFAARIMHLEGSTHELKTMRQKLSFEYFRQLHIARDKVIREISAAKVMTKDDYGGGGYTEMEIEVPDK